MSLQESNEIKYNCQCGESFSSLQELNEHHHWWWVDLVDLFQEILESDGYKVCAFIDPIQAFNTLEKKFQEYGLILSDFRMPNLNGHELCTKLKQLNPQFSNFNLGVWCNRM